ncbi:MAG TPA: hypothetical protein VEQ59_09610 [Polyangiaceae bacterium]|nr:hypothetical protein [Polyangiaceae bacterium]
MSNSAGHAGRGGQGAAAGDVGAPNAGVGNTEAANAGAGNGGGGDAGAGNGPGIAGAPTDGGVGGVPVGGSDGGGEGAASGAGGEGSSACYVAGDCASSEACSGGALEQRCVVTGSGCENHAQCAAGSYCDGARCLVAAAAGSPCSPGERCATGSSCVAGTCLQDLAAQDECNVYSGPRCGGEAICLYEPEWCNGTSDCCVPLGGASGTCYSLPCVDGLVCGPTNVCVPGRTSGYCNDSDLLCAATHYCDDADFMCVLLPGVGEPCAVLGFPFSSTVRCSADAFCGDDEICRPKAALHAACSDALACAPGLTCTAAHVGGACTLP